MEKITNANGGKIMKMKGEIYLLVGIMVCSLAFGLIALTYPELKTKLVPGIVSGIVFVLAAVQLVKELLQKEPPEKGPKANEQGEEEDFSEATVEWRENLVAFGWLAGFLAAIYLLGFLISILLFVFSYMKVHRFGWTKSILTAVLATAAIYVVFIAVLRADLFPGIITALLLPLLE